MDPEVSKPVNIGVNYERPSMSHGQKMDMWKSKKSQPELEQAVRLRKCEYRQQTEHRHCGFSLKLEPILPDRFKHHMCHFSRDENV